MHLVLRTIHSTEIDRKKWDICVNNSVNSKIYGYSWFLDNVFSNWYGIVDENYRAVFPLPIINKNTIGKVAFMHELNIYGIKTTIDIINQFTKAIPENYKIKNLPISLSSAKLNLYFTQKKTYYYSKDLIAPNKFENINESTSLENNYSSSIISIKNLTDFTKKNTISTFNKNDINALKRIIRFTTHYKFGYLKGIFSLNNTLIGTYFYITFKDRIYLLVCNINKSSDSKSVYEYILKEIINEFKNKNLILDCYTYNNKIQESWLQNNLFIKKTIINVSTPTFLQKLFTPYNKETFPQTC